jgi:hypothetical protein
MIRRFGVLLLMVACASLTFSQFGAIGSAHAFQKNANEAKQKGSNRIYGKVTEVLNSAGYTYARVDTGSEKVWAATSTTPINVGDMIAFTTDMPMRDFHSTSMNRDFPLLYFVNQFFTDSANQAVSSAPASSPLGMINKDATTKPVINIDKLEGGNTIAEVYADREKLNGKVIRVRGQVTKYTANVMGKNWLHIKDSSTQDDLTITSDNSAELDSVVIIEGKLAVDKDFGYGYMYPLIVQDASITKE